MYCFILYLPKVPFFHGWRALLRLGFLILDALWSQLGLGYAELLYTIAASEFNGRF